MTTLKRKDQREASKVVLKPDFQHQNNIHDLSCRQLTILDMNLVLTAYGSLTTVNLSNNLLVTLPQSFSRCLGHVQVLDLSRNRLQMLPDNFYLLKNLHSLFLYHNKLQTLPICFWKLDKLNWLDLAANPLDARMQQICGVELTQGATVAKNVREFFYLLQHAADSYAECKNQNGNSIPMQNLENYQQEMLQNQNHSNFPDFCDGDLNLRAHETSDNDIDSDHQSSYFPAATKKLTHLKSKSKMFIPSKLRSQFQSQNQFQKFYEDENQNKNQLPTPKTGTSLGLGLLQKLLIVTCGCSVLFLILSLVYGPPCQLLNGHAMQRYESVPEWILNSVAWFFYCTIYQLRPFVLGIEDLAGFLVVTRSPSLFERIFGW